MTAENERVKTLLTKLQNSRYRKALKSNIPERDLATSDRLSEASRGGINREIIKLKKENAQLKQINQDVTFVHSDQRKS